MKKIAESLDYFFNKLLPKKFIVLTVATVLIFIDKLDGEQWFIVAAAYLGVNAVQKFAGPKK
jgi:hypothetical protein